MNGLIITHHGALGDHGYSLPALGVLRKRYDKIALYCKKAERIEPIFRNTGYIDKYISFTEKVMQLDNDDKRRWLIEQLGEFRVTHSVDFHGIVPGRYMFHGGDSLFEKPISWARQNASGVSFFDEFSRRAGVLDEAKGKRPRVVMDKDEQRWLKRFRGRYGIPKDAFLLGWQFTGSAQIKWYPHFQEVVTAIMNRYPNTYLVATGDKWCDQLTWRGAGKRYINLANKVSFRQAFLLTSIYDCFVSPETGVFVISGAFPHTPKILLATHTAGYHIAFDETKIIQSDAPCSPCYKILFNCIVDEPHEYMRCAGRIAPHKVIEAIDEVVRRKEINSIRHRQRIPEGVWVSPSPCTFILPSIKGRT